MGSGFEPRAFERDSNTVHAPAQLVDGNYNKKRDRQTCLFPLCGDTEAVRSDLVMGTWVKAQHAFRVKRSGISMDLSFAATTRHDNSHGTPFLTRTASIRWTRLVQQCWVQRKGCHQYKHTNTGLSDGRRSKTVMRD